MSRNIIKLNEKQLKEVVTRLVQKKITEGLNTNDFFDEMNKIIDDPNKYYQDEETQYPEDVYEWGRKAQKLGLELSRLCGKYRFENEEVYESLEKIQEEYNAVCGDLNTYGISNHWDS